MRIFQTVPLIRNVSPSESFANVTLSDPLLFSVEKIFPSMRVEWLVNDEVTATGNTDFELNPRTLGNGFHRIKARVYDTSPFVRKDPRQSLSDTHSWSLDVNVLPENAVLFENWIQERFPDDPNHQTASADPDRDGLDNLTEFFWDTDPNSPNSQMNLIAIGEINGILYMDLNRDPSPINLTAFIEGSNDLNAWLPVARSTHGDLFEIEDGPVIIHLANDNYNQRIFDTSPARGDSQRFLRLRLQQTGAK